MCTDLDGTLLSSDKRISKENKDAIEYFKSEGGYFTFITGRMPYFVKDIYTAVEPNAPFGCVNGGGLYDHVKQEYVQIKCIDREVLELVEYAEKNVEGIGIQVNALSKIYFCSENSAQEHFRQVTGVPDVRADYREVTEDFAKILFADLREEAIQSLARILPSHPLAHKFDFIRSEKILYEILPKGINKGFGLKSLAQILGIDMKRTVAVGDYNNDIDMLKAAGVGVAVANACPEAKEAADRVTVSNDEHAIARIIEDIDKGIINI